MPIYNFAVVTELNKKPIFRFSAGRSFTDSFKLSSGAEARICVQDFGYIDGPHLLKVVNDDQLVLAEASVVSDTSQVFRHLSLLIHFRISQKN